MHRAKLNAAAAWRLLVARASVAPLGWRRTRRLLTPPRAASGSDVPPERIASAIAAASRRLPFAFTCLHRALAAESLLRRHGYAADLRFGVSRASGRFEAHAWIELDGRAWNDAKRFVPLSGAL